MMINTKSRIKEIDIIKAISILIMVANHAYYPGLKVLTIVNMPVFFIASGYTYNSDYSNNIKSLISFFWKKIKSLYLPYILWNTIHYLLFNILLKINIYTDNKQIFTYIGNNSTTLKEYLSFKEILTQILKGFVMASGFDFGDSMWFLKALLILSIIFCSLEYMLKRIFHDDRKINITNFILSIVFLFIGYYLHLMNNRRVIIGCVFSSYILFFIGTFLKRINNKMNYNLITTIIAYVILFLLKQNENIILAFNQYNNPISLVLCSICGWYIMYYLASILMKFETISKILCIIGENTLSILMFHLLAFKIVNLIQILIYELPIYCLASYPTLLNPENSWWLLYTIVGVLVPVSINVIKKQIVH